VLASDVPIGIGVSSSAAICVALSQALSVDDLRARDLVLIAQEAEHRAGTPCGTMDQSASVAGGVIRFDGASLEYETLDPRLGDVAFLVIDSGVHRALSESSYPVRVDECRRARAWLTEVLGHPVGHLASVSPAIISGLPEDGAETSVLHRRIRHVVSETRRVEAGSAAVAASDWATFGRLMTESGRSSAGDYEISHPVVESILERLLGLPEVLGARMMGGGEGGSLIAIVRNGSDPSVRERILQSANSDVAGGAPPRQVFAFSFAAGAAVGPLTQ
jgi:galactokinase